MGNCTVTIKKRTGIVPTGQAVVADIALSTSYATGGDTVVLKDLALPDGCDVLVLQAGASSPAGHALEIINGATPATAPKIRVRDVATGVEITATTNLSAQSVRAMGYQLPNI